MKTYKVTVSYDGTEYSGWQLQSHKTGIVNILQDHFKKLFNQEIKLLGSSRTDAGVHAVGQVARFYSDIAIDPKRMLFAWNNVLPRDVLIRDLSVVSDDFNPRNVVEKIYYYHFFITRPLPFMARCGWQVKLPIDLVKLYQSLQVLVGTHDFRSFCTGYDKENTVRTIESISLTYIGRFGCYQIRVVGKGFLRHMVRRMVGAAMDIALDKDQSINKLVEALDAKNPHQQFFTAPAHGLMLRKVFYKKN